MKLVEIKPILIVDSLWHTGRPRMTPEEEKQYVHWDDEIHANDLLRDSGVIRTTRYRDLDDRGTLHIQEYDSADALQKYLVSERRKELIRETNSHYVAGPDPKNFFEKRTVRCFIPVSSKSLK
jgi:hypothetical protein